MPRHGLLLLRRMGAVGKDVRSSAFSVRRSAFSVQRSAFGVRRSAFSGAVVLVGKFVCGSQPEADDGND
jgi:hypothetical protein